MRRPQPADGLRSTRKSRTFYPVDPALQERMRASSFEGSYTFMLHQDLDFVIPYIMGRGGEPEEVAEETGLRVRLLPAPAALPLPPGYPHEPVAAPWWVTELDVPADNHTPVAHVHIDHQYVALAASTVAVSDPAHPFGWFSVEQIGEIEMFEDTRLLARALFGCVGGLADEVQVDEVVAALSHA